MFRFLPLLGGLCWMALEKSLNSEVEIITTMKVDFDAISLYQIKLFPFLCVVSLFFFKTYLVLHYHQCIVFPYWTVWFLVNLILLHREKCSSIGSYCQMMSCTSDEIFLRLLDSYSQLDIRIFVVIMTLENYSYASFSIIILLVIDRPLS